MYFCNSGKVVFLPTGHIRNFEELVAVFGDCRSTCLASRNAWSFLFVSSERKRRIDAHGLARISSGAAAIVVGVADNVKNNGLTEQSDPEMYTLRRSVSSNWGENHLMVIVESTM